jgi:hypothetical protein
MANSTSDGARRARRTTLGVAGGGVAAGDGVVALALVTGESTAASVDTVAGLSVTTVGAAGRLPATPAVGLGGRGVGPGRDG